MSVYLLNTLEWLKARANKSSVDINETSDHVFS